ncbi:MAG: hypothetical protein AABY22_25860 [Nanoarchaeota archaeon]
MALKDWKKTEKSHWRNLIKHQSIGVNKVFVNNEPELWEFHLNKFGELRPIKFKVFKKKSQALKFAKKYMRSH